MSIFFHKLLRLSSSSIFGKPNQTMMNTKATNNERNAEEEERPHDEKPCYILQLPDHITQDIFLRIPFKTVFACRFVCKCWHRSLSNPSFTKTLVPLAPPCHLLRDVDTNRKLLLADVKGVGRTENMVLELSDHPDALHNKVEISYSLNSGFIGSCNGFLCLFLRSWQTASHQINISNPVTGEYLALPIYNSFENFPHHFGFGFSPVSLVYKVVLITQRQYMYSQRHIPSDKFEDDEFEVKDKLEVMVLTVGSGSWRRNGKVYNSVYTRYGVFHNGFLHWICNSKRSNSQFIRAFDVENERFKELAMPAASVYYGDRELGVLNGSLSISGDSYDSFVVWVMKEYGWTKELEISDTIDNPITTTDGLTCSPSPLSTKAIKVLNLIKGEEALVLDESGLSLVYNPATRSFVRFHIDGIPYGAEKVMAGVHIPSFVSPKDIISDYISKHPEEVAETSVQVSDAILQEWTASFAGMGREP